MTRDDIIRISREAGGVDIASNGWTSWVGTQSTEFLERFAALVAAAEREAFPDLTAVINWLENGCDPKEAAKELRLYTAAIRAKSAA